MDKWFLKDGQIFFKDENAELNNWDLKSVVSCLNTRDEKIDDLESKIEEYNSKIIEEMELSEERRQIIEDLSVENNDLRHQLAESEKDLEIVCVEGKDTIREYAEITNRQQEEIFKLRQQLQEEKNRNKKLNHEAQKYYEDAYCNGSQNEKAIAELEKVRTCFGDYLKGLFWNDTMLVGKVCNMVNEIIDQQIAELKGDK